MTSRPLLALALLLAGPAVPARQELDPSAALAEGNRLFRDGQLDAAYRVYAAGLDPADPDPLLAYNLATTAHHLDRLPEAVLWYRRAAAARPADAWLSENLALARRDLGTGEPDRPLTAALRERRRGLTLAAALLAWAALALLLAGLRAAPAPRRARAWEGRGRAGAAALALLALALFAAGRLPAVLGPRAAVLLKPCGGLRAGSEVWVRVQDAGHWRVTAGGPVCRAAVVGLVEG